MKNTLLATCAAIALATSSVSAHESEDSPHVKHWSPKRNIELGDIELVG
jgi:hypothetical protein